ncbi:hypothetical protein [Burkholderia gladioli]|uniref:hypothetical protein n=1 Tax=Burkholderia gladioli TaxID=28095 RepID=UPI00163F8CDC|nr:hypothetical protein [Burkholderia gladioli]
MFSQQDWINRCAARYIERGGCTNEIAREMAEAAYEHRESDDDPEAIADEDMSYWAEDA